MGEGDSYFLNNDNLKKVHNAYNRNKAVRIKFDDNEMEGSGFGGIRKGLKKATHIANKINQTLHNENLDRKISTTSRKIKNTINKGEVIGDLGIPVLSDLYNTVQSAANEGDRLVQRGLKAKSQLVKDFDETNDQYKSGSGMNQRANKYMPTGKNGGSFRVLGGSVNRFVGDDSSTMVKTNSPSFHPLALKSYKTVQHGG
jgi:hypothetical protein